MNRKGLKAAAKQCLLDADTSPRKLTLYYCLCIYGLMILYNVLDYFLQRSVGTGLSALSVRSRVNFISTAFYVVLMVCNVLWTTHYYHYALRLSRGQSTSFRDFLTPFSMAGTVLAVNLLSFLYIYLWCFVFIIPGLIAAYRYRLARYLIFDRSCSASMAIRESKRLTYGHKLDLLKLDLSFLWYGLLLSVPGVGSSLYAYGLWDISEGNYLIYYLVCTLFSICIYVWKMPYVETTYAHAYNWIVQEDAPT